MLKQLIKTVLIPRWQYVPKMLFSKPFQVHEQQFVSDSESDIELDTKQSSYTLQNEFKSARTPQEILLLCKSNDLSSSSLYVPTFMLNNLIQRNSDDPTLYEFADLIIPTLQEQSLEQLLANLSLFIKFYKKDYAYNLKPIIDQKLEEFTNIQLCYLFILYARMQWNNHLIGKYLKQYLPDQTFTPHSLQSLIRGCYISERLWRGTQFADLAYSAQRALLPLIENINIHAMISLFFHLSRMKLQRTTSHKKFPKLLYELSSYFKNNLPRLSSFAKIKIIESYIHLPDNFDSQLFQIITPSILNEIHTSQTYLKLFVTYTELPPQLRLDQEQLNSFIRKVEFTNKLSLNLLISFISCADGEQYKEQINQSIQILKSCKLNFKQQNLLASSLLNNNLIDMGQELLMQDVENIGVLLQQAHIQIEKSYKNTTPKQQQRFTENMKKIIGILNNLEEHKIKTILNKILELEPQQNDPLYNYFEDHLDFTTLNFHDQCNFALKLSNKMFLPEKIRNKLEQFQPTIQQLSIISSQISNLKNVTDKIVKHLSQWITIYIEKSIIDETFDINAAIDIYIKMLINSPIYSLHNMKGTVSKYFRDLTISLSKQTYLNKTKIDITITSIQKIHQSFNQLNMKTSLLHNLIQNYCQFQTKDLNFAKLDLCEVISEIDVQFYNNKQIILKFLQECQLIELDTITASVQKSKIEMFLAKHSNVFSCKFDEIQLKLQMENLQQSILGAQLPKHKECVIEAILVLLDYDGWRFNHLDVEQDGLNEFINNHFNSIEPYINMKNMRGGLKTIIKTINFYESKYKFINQYEQLFKKIFGKCKVLRNQEKLHISVCLDYLEFGKKLKIRDNETIKFLLDKITAQTENLRQSQVIDTLQKLCEMKIYNKELFDKLSEVIISKHQYYSYQELLDGLTAFAKCGYFNYQLSKLVSQQQKQQKHKTNFLQSVQHLWGILLCLRIHQNEGKPLNKESSELVTSLLNDALKFSQIFDGKSKIPLAFRQYMDLYNILHFSLHTELNFNIQQVNLATKIVNEGHNIVDKYILHNQKLNQPLRTVIPFFEEAKLEYKMNYLFDNQYVDYYVPSKKTIYIADNSIYMSLDLESYSGFHYFNDWILQAICKKYEVKVLRINVWKWMQQNKAERQAVLDL